MEISTSWKRTINFNIEDISLSDTTTYFSEVFMMTIGLEELKISIDGCIYKNRSLKNCMNLTLTYIDDPVYCVDKIILNDNTLNKNQNGIKINFTINNYQMIRSVPNYCRIDISGKIISERPFPLTKKYEDFYLNDSFSDIKIISQDEVSFPAHRIFLSNHSKVFKQMLTTDMIEKRSNQINIEDADGDTIKEFLRFIYLGEVEDKKQVLPLFYLAEKYEISALKSYCAYLSINHTCYENVLELIDLAEKCNENLMFFNCVKFIMAHFEEIKNLEEWETLSNSVMTNIMNNMIDINVIVNEESIVKPQGK
ncbi:hypothetical protein PVAND_012598 [Polypedilum vanderplanki]|uniref:BTB domain-containing protein n=1 Tax=Polypedilum vanderplanki TaxID=319348 RepID=A0A9J6CMY6_POLVA|nr:hypothetical protein PVAND_012598 [Polypedilum vanderplanki]